MADLATARRSPLHEIRRTGDFGAVKDDAPGVSITERPALSIIQVAAWADQAAAAAAGVEQAAGVKPSRDPCSATHSDDSDAIWLGPDRWLIVEKESRDLYAAIRGAVDQDRAAITDQSHSRCVLRLSGPEARNVLRKGTTLDMDPGYFKPGQARTTSLFHMNALIHCVGEDAFDVYVARSFGQSFYEVLTHAAAEYGYRVEDPM